DRADRPASSAPSRGGRSAPPHRSAPPPRSSAPPDYGSSGGEPDQTGNGPLSGPPEPEQSGPFWLRPMRRRR
ncbi:MAG TPA: hypothetical protein VHU92_12770, partial [Streptosporangiaceae bacterium]|nr:hypothetical protein [Streptosporangiaceae bacterium]